MNTSKNQPVHAVRLGRIKATIWRNATTTEVHYNVTFSRIFRDDEGWQSTESFGREDLLLLAKVADQAHSWIHFQVKEADQLQLN